MVVTFYKVKKRLNSTKQPSGASRSFTCVIKEPCNNLEPRIEIQWDGSENLSTYNYMVIPAFNNRCYYVTWTFENRKWVAHGKVDVLATYKTEIGAASKYVLRSASEKDDEVIDTKYPAKATCNKTVITNIGPNWPQYYTGGRFVVGITGQGNTFSSGGVGYIVCTASEFQAILNAAYIGAGNLWPSSTGSTIGEALAGLGENMQKSLSQPYQFINSVLWLPYVPSTGAATVVTLGTINTGISVATLDQPFEQIAFTVAIDTNPAGAGSPAWKNLPPFVRYILEFPPFGVHELDATVLRGASSLACHMVVDNTNGEAYFYATAGNSGGATVLAVPGKIGVEIPVAGIMTNTLGAVGGIMGTVANAIANPSIIGKIAGVVSGVGDATQAMLPRAVGGGNIGGGFAALHGNRRFTTLYYSPVDEDNAEVGSPLCKVKTISSLSGYVLCADGEIALTGATESELAQVQSYLTGGFFYE